MGLCHVDIIILSCVYGVVVVDERGPNGVLDVDLRLPRVLFEVEIDWVGVGRAF